MPACERKLLAANVGEWEVGGQPQLAGESFEADMMRTLQHRWPLPGPPQLGIADYSNARSTFSRLDDPNQLCRAKRAAELQKPRREVRYLERAGRGSKRCFKDVCVWQIALRAGFSAGRANPEASAILAVQECRTHWFGIKARQTTPDNLPSVVHESGKLAVPDYA